MSSSGIASVLRNTSLFAGLSEEQLAEVVRVVSEQRFRPGERIIEAASTEDAGMWIIVDGVVEVRKDQMPLYRFGTGDHFGEMALVSEERIARSADVVAMGDVTAVELRREDLMAVLASGPGVAMSMLAELARRLRETTARLQETERNLKSPDQADYSRSVLEEDEYFAAIARSAITPSISQFGPNQERH